MHSEVLFLPRNGFLILFISKFLWNDGMNKINFLSKKHSTLPLELIATKVHKDNGSNDMSGFDG